MNFYYCLAPLNQGVKVCSVCVTLGKEEEWFSLFLSISLSLSLSFLLVFLVLVSRELRFVL